MVDNKLDAKQNDDIMYGFLHELANITLQLRRSKDYALAIISLYNVRDDSEQLKILFISIDFFTAALLALWDSLYITVARIYDQDSSSSIRTVLNCTQKGTLDELLRENLGTEYYKLSDLVKLSRKSVFALKDIIQLIGVNHNDPFGRMKVQSVLRDAAKLRFIPDTIGVEWKSECASSVINQREQFANLNQERYPKTSNSDINTLKHSLAYEADTHIDIYPEIPIIWLDECREIDPQSIIDYAWIFDLITV